MKTWLITGASRGLGLAIARSALADGDQVVATAREQTRITQALGQNDHLLALSLDVTDQNSIRAAVDTALDRFGRIDVLVNNAGYGQLGAFEELSDSAIDRQFQTNVFGVFNTTRAVLPCMRAQRSGHVITISSMAGIVGLEGAAIYCAAKFAVAGWSESLSRELARFGIKATSIHPGMFRTDFLDSSSVSHGDVEVDDYRDFAAARRRSLEASNHQQTGDPEKFGDMVVALAKTAEPPVRIAAGADALAMFAKRADELNQSATTWRDLAESTAFD